MSDEKRRVRLPQWREDFPVEWERDHYVTRRELTKFFVLGSGLLASANVGIAVEETRRSRLPKNHPIERIAAAASLSAGESMLFRYPTKDDPCILIRTRDGNLVAFSQVCTHLSCAVVYRSADERLICPCHNGLFDCGQGGGGAQPLAGPPERPLPRVRLELHDGEVFAVGLQ